MKLPVAVAGAVLVLFAGTACSSDDEPTAEASATAAPDPFTVSCPQVDPVEKQEFTPFRAVRSGAPKLVAELGVHDLGDRDFCVVAESHDSPEVAARIVSYTVELDQRDNYGERYSTFSRDGSDELLNFPFYFRVYGACRTVSATIVVRADGTAHEYRATTAAGPRCSPG